MDRDRRQTTLRTNNSNGRFATMRSGRMDSGHWVSLDAGLIPAACFYYLHRTSKSPSHAQRHRMRFVGHVPKDGMPVAGSVPCLCLATKTIKKVMPSLKHDRRRLFLFSWHATQKEATTPANETRLGMDLPRRAPQRWPKSMALSAHTGSWRVATVFYARWREPPVWV